MWDELTEEERASVNRMTQPAREVATVLGSTFANVCEAAGYSPADGSNGAGDLLDLRWSPEGKESMFLSQVHRVGHRLIAIHNHTEGMARLLHNHAPVFSLPPLVRAVLATAARVHYLLAPHDSVERAASYMLDWCESLERRANLAVAGGLPDEAKRQMARRQSVAARYGFTALKSGHVRYEKSGARFQLPGEEAMVSQLFAGLVRRLDGEGERMGRITYQWMTGVAHAESFALARSLDVRPAPDESAPVLTLTSMQLEAAELFVQSAAVVSAIKSLAETLHLRWGWPVERLAPACDSARTRLTQAYGMALA